MEESKKLDNENLSEIDQKKDYIKRLDNNISTVMSQRKIAEEGIELLSDMQLRLKKAFASIEEGVTDPKSIQAYESLKLEDLSVARREVEELENSVNSSKKQLDELYEKISELFNLNIGYVGFGFIPVILMIISSIIVIYVGFSYDKDIKYNSGNTSNNSDESDKN